MGDEDRGGAARKADRETDRGQRDREELVENGDHHGVGEAARLLQAFAVVVENPAVAGERVSRPERDVGIVATAHREEGNRQERRQDGECMWRETDNAAVSDHGGTLTNLGQPSNGSC